MIPESLFPLGNHLWQSTVFAAVVGLLTLVLRKNQAKTRHWMWLIASLKFLVPFSLLVAIGSHVGWRTAPAIPRTELSSPGLTMAMNEMGQPFPAVEEHAPPPARPMAPLLLPALWLCGCAGVLLSWCVRWRRIGRVARGSVPLLDGRELESLRRLRHIAGMRRGIELKSSGAALEPGAFGLFRPVLLLPRGIADCLTDEQLDAIVAHELCHILRRDNLTAAIHMIVEAVFWFHPLVWWLGARLVEERERACDEEVLRLGSRPEVYAEGILTVCKFYLESPLACVAGVTGSSIKRRIEAIMSNRTALKLNFGKKVALTFAGIAAVAVPITVGIVHAPVLLAQPQATPPSPAATTRQEFEVASIRPTAPLPPPPPPDGGGGRGKQPSPGGVRRCGIAMNGGRVDVGCTSLLSLIAFAFRAHENRITGPDWMATQRFDILAKLPEGASEAQVPEMLQALLADRFKLAVHRGTQEQAVYALVVDKGGLKVKPAAPEADAPPAASAALDPNAPPPPPSTIMQIGGLQTLRTVRGLDADGRPPQQPGLLVVELTNPRIGTVRDRPNHIEAPSTAFQGLADFLTDANMGLDQPVVDMTGLSGRYQVLLEIAPGSLEDLLAAGPPGSPGFAAFQNGRRAALQDALQKEGLKLEPRKGPVETIVVDHVEKPSDN